MAAVHHQDKPFAAGEGHGMNPNSLDKASRAFLTDGHVRDCMVWNQSEKRPELHRFVRQFDPETHRDVVTREPYTPRPFNRAPELGKSRVWVPEEDRSTFYYKGKQMEGGVAETMIWWPTQERLKKALAEQGYDLPSGRGNHGAASHQGYAHPPPHNQDNHGSGEHHPHGGHDAPGQHGHEGPAKQPTSYTSQAGYTYIPNPGAAPAPASGGQTGAAPPCAECARNKANAHHGGGGAPHDQHHSSPSASHH